MTQEEQDKALLHDRNTRAALRRPNPTQDPEKIYVLYHGDCPDGFCAALVAHEYFFAHMTPSQAARVTFAPVFYGRPMPSIPDGCDVYILDFSYPREVLEALAARCNVAVLDHHISAQEALRGGVEGALVRFDLTKSGAMLALYYFTPHTVGLARLAAYVQDRDLWEHKLPFTHEINAALRYIPREFGVWELFAHDLNHGLEGWNINRLDKYGDRLERMDRIVREGRTTLKVKAQMVAEIIKHAQLWDLGDGPCAVVNASLPGDLTSEVGHALLQKYPEACFALIWSFGRSGVGGALRSREDVDVSVLARRHGGGGHKQAAGFGLGEEASRALVEAVKARLNFAPQEG
jgi:oligoribonuclease NrnB/cAMP/cGMP phosphodiesterase (DHH superfamily)